MPAPGLKLDEAREPAASAARRPLGARRPGGQGKADPHGSHPAICKGRDRRLDGRGRFIREPLVPTGAPPRISGKDACGAERSPSQGRGSA